MPSEYTPSGKFGLSFIAWILLAAAVSVGIGWLYQLLISAVPFIYLNFLFTIVFAGALWFAVRFSVEWGDCRNPVLAAALGLAVGFVGLGASYYFDYLSFVQLAVEQEGLAAGDVRAQVGFWDWIGIRVEEGYEISRRGRGGLPLTGVFVYLVWGIEAVVIGGVPAFSGFEHALDPYCESCDEWCREATIHPFPNPSESVIREVDAAETLEEVVDPDIEFAPTQRERALNYEIEACPECDATTFLSVVLQTVTYDSDGDEEIDETPLWSKLEVDSPVPERVSDLHARVLDRLEPES